MTVGDPAHGIIKFAVPLILGYILQQMYLIVDAAIVGRWIGVDALAAVGASASVMFLVMGFCNGACAGFAIPIARAFGAKDFKKMRVYVANSIRVSLVMIVVITFFACAFCDKILRIVNTPREIFDDAYTFLLLQFLAIPFTLTFNLFAGYIRALGNSRQPFLFLIISSFVNILLDVLLILILGMGVAGAGLATLLSQLFASILSVWYVVRHMTMLIPHGDERAFDNKRVSILLNNGIPMGLQVSITAIGIILLQSSNNVLGTVYVASFTAAVRIKYLFICVFDNIGVAMATYCGQNIGAGRLDRVRQGEWAAMKIMMVYFVFTALVIFPFAGNMMELFVNGSSQAVADNAAMLMRISCYFYPVLGLLAIFRYSIQGLGYSNLSMLSGVMEMIARSGVSLWLVPAFGFLGVCYGDPMAWVFADIFLVPGFLLLYRHLKKKHGVASL